jgi:hypothetical protein
MRFLLLAPVFLFSVHALGAGEPSGQQFDLSKVRAKVTHERRFPSSAGCLSGRNSLSILEAVTITDYSACSADEIAFLKEVLKKGLATASQTALDDNESNRNIALVGDLGEIGAIRASLNSIALLKK